MEERKLIPLNHVARMLRVPVRWLRAEAQAGRVPHLNAGGQLLANIEQVEAALFTQLSHAAADGGEVTPHVG